MLRPIRLLLTFVCFAIFFGGSLLLGLVFCPLVWLLTIGNRERTRDFCTGFIAWGYGWFIRCTRLMGLIRLDGRVEVPEAIRDRPYVLVANHPTLIDVLFLLHWFPRLTCVVKKSWYDFFFWGALLRSTHYLPNVDPEEEGLPGAAILDRMTEHVKAGHPLVFFPEGTRSLATSLHRFKRGAFELAERAQVPLVMVFIDVDRPFLMKGVPFWKTASGTARYRLELVDVVEPSPEGDQGVQRRNEAQRRYEELFRRSLEGRAIKDLPAEPEALPAPKDVPSSR